MQATYVEGYNSGNMHGWGALTDGTTTGQCLYLFVDSQRPTRATVRAGPAIVVRIELDLTLDRP